MEKLFFEIALVLVLAGGVSLIVNWLKQPAILAYIVTGLIIIYFYFKSKSYGQCGYWHHFASWHLSH
jgi:Kef-type K+ transport system membrane component KefB